MTLVLKDEGKRKLPFDEERLNRFIDEMTKDFNSLSVQSYKDRTIKSIVSQDTYKAEEITSKLILNAMDNISKTETEWTFVAARIYLKKLYKEAAYNRAYDANEKYGSLIGLLKKLGEIGVYSELILRDYSIEELKLAQSFIDPEKDKLFTYAGLKTLADRYLAKGYSEEIYEIPQERYLIIALTLMSKENKKHRMDLVKEAYWALSNQYTTVATPTLANSGKSYGQLSSCFIDTVDDSLQGIYDSNTDIANCSKNAGGIGAYLGKIRSRGSDIKGFKGVSSGIVPWARQLNNTAVSVDQLG